MFTFSKTLGGRLFFPPNNKTDITLNGKGDINMTDNTKTLKVKLWIHIGNSSFSISTPYESHESPELWVTGMK